MKRIALLAAMLMLGTFTVTQVFAAVTANQLSNALFGKTYSITQSYLSLWSGNPTPDRRHAGIDYGAPAGTNVRAVIGGEVLYAGGSYGTVSVYDGRNTVIYLHLTNITVRAGQRIQFATTLGKAGNAGTKSAHLHIEVRRGRQNYAVGPTSGKTTAELTLNPLHYF